MASVSAGILAVLVIASLSISVLSFPEGCTKLKGSPGDGMPGEYFVKVYSTVRANTIVKIMLELTNSGCEGKLWRSSNTSNAIMAPITCSDMFYMESFGFFAKLSDAAVMWVCENDAVDYIQPNGRVSVTPSTPDEPDPDYDGTDEPDGSGAIDPVDILIPTPAPKCTKIKEYRDDRETIYYRFIVVMYQDTNDSYIRSFVEDLKAESNRLNSTIKIISIQLLRYVNMIIAEMNMKAMEHVCENSKVKSIEYDVNITIPPPTTHVTTTTPPPTITTAQTTSPPQTTPSTQCDKLRGGKIRLGRLNLCRIYMTKSSTKFDCRRFVRKLKAMDDNAKNDVQFKLKEVGHDRQRPMIIARINQQALDMICKSKNTDRVIRI